MKPSNDIILDEQQINTIINNEHLTTVSQVAYVLGVNKHLVTDHVHKQLYNEHGKSYNMLSTYFSLNSNFVYYKNSEIKRLFVYEADGNHTLMVYTTVDY